MHDKPAPEVAADGPESNAERPGGLAASAAGQALQDARLAQLTAEHACPHGAMGRKAWMSKSGKVWAGWFCPDGITACKPEWADVREIVEPALDAWADGRPV